METPKQQKKQYLSMLKTLNQFFTQKKYSQEEKITALYEILTIPKARISFLKTLGLKEEEIQDLMNHKFHEDIISMMFGSFYDFSFRNTLFFAQQPKQDTFQKEVQFLESPYVTRQYLLHCFQNEKDLGEMVVGNFLIMMTFQELEEMFQDSFMLYYRKIQHMLTINPSYELQKDHYTLPEIIDNILLFYYIRLSEGSITEVERCKRFANLLREDTNLVRKFFYNFYISYKGTPSYKKQERFLSLIERGQLTRLTQAFLEDEIFAYHITKLSFHDIPLEKQLEQKTRNIVKLQTNTDIPKELKLSIALYEIGKN